MLKEKYVWAVLLFEFAFHGTALNSLYLENTHIFSSASDMADFFVWVLLGELIFAFGFYFIF